MNVNKTKFITFTLAETPHICLMLSLSLWHVCFHSFSLQIKFSHGSTFVSSAFLQIIWQKCYRVWTVCVCEISGFVFLMKQQVGFSLLMIMCLAEISDQGSLREIIYPHWYKNITENAGVSLKVNLVSIL